MTTESLSRLDNAEHLYREYEKIRTQENYYGSKRVAKAMLRRSAELGCPEARMEFLRLYYRKREYLNGHNGVPQETIDEWIDSLTSSDNPGRTENLDRMYQHGTILFEDDESETEFNRRQAEAGSDYSYRYLCRKYKGNDPELFRITYKTVEAGNAKAKHTLAHMYFHGRGTTRSLSDAGRLFTELKDTVYSAREYLALIDRMQFVGIGNFDDLFVYLSDEAEEGDVETLYLLALCHRLGLGTEKSDTEAEKLANMAAELDYTPAMNLLASMEFESEGLPIELCKKSADLGDPIGYYILGRIYLNLNAEDIDSDDCLYDALDAFRKATELGFDCSELIERNTPSEEDLELAELHRNPDKFGVGDIVRLCKPDYGILKPWCLEYMSDAIKRGEPEALFHYAESVSPEEAFPYYFQSAEKGFVPAMKKMADIYRTGSGTIESHEDSIIWLRKAAEGGDVDAQYELGQRYESGNGIEPDLQLAKNWYLKAAMQDDVEAYDAYRKLMDLD